MSGKFVIKKGGLYVAKRGHWGSYTKDLREAQKYPSEEAAKSDFCPGNERIVSLSHELVAYIT